MLDIDSVGAEGLPRRSLVGLILSLLVLKDSQEEASKIVASFLQGLLISSTLGFASDSSILK
jgi:hypothetical protein